MSSEQTQSVPEYTGKGKPCAMHPADRPSDILRAFLGLTLPPNNSLMASRSNAAADWYSHGAEDNLIGWAIPLCRQMNL